MHFFTLLKCVSLCCRLGPVALATQSVLLVSGSTTYQAPFALSVATSVRYALRPCRPFSRLTRPQSGQPAWREEGATRRCCSQRIHRDVIGDKLGMEVSRTLCVARLRYSRLGYSAMFMVFRKSWAHIFNDDPGERRTSISPRLDRKR